MELVLNLCAKAHEIKNIMAKSFPHLSYELLGENRDYTLVLEDIDESAADNVISCFKDMMYGDGELTLAETLVELLKERNLTISVAESCTGGMLSAALVDVNGASKVFYEGVVSYNNLSKIKRLDVHKSTLENYGAVSDATAAEMAMGLAESSNSDITVSVTGIAGPQGGSFEKPVGLVYIAIAYQKDVKIYKNIFNGTREEIRAKAKNMALFYTIKTI
jgi:nicotinamide-nucleotide amidase